MRRGASEPETRKRRGLPAAGIAGKLALASFLCCCLVALAGIAGAYLWQRAELVDRLQAETRAAVLGAINARTYPSLGDLHETGEHLVRSSDIAGGRFVSGVGAPRGEFGEPPELSWEDARLEGRHWALDPSRRWFDIFIAPEEIGLSYGLLVRVRADRHWQALLRQLAGLAVFGLAAALLVCAVTGLAARRLVSHPLKAIRASVAAGLDAPDQVAGHQSRIPGNDEVGVLSREVDSFLERVSVIMNRDLAAARSVIDRCPYAVLKCAPDGQVEAVNEAALTLFEVRSLDQVPGFDGGPLCLFQGEPTTVAGLLAEGAALGPGEVIRRDVSIPVRVGADTMRGPDGEVLGHFIMLVDVSDMVADMRRQVAFREDAIRRQRRAEGELARLKSQFEACMVILEHQQGVAAPAFPVTIDPASLLADWLDEAVERAEMAPDGIVHDELPPLRGDPGVARKLFRYLIEAVWRRHRDGRPVIAVEAVREGDFARLTVRGLADPIRQLTGPLDPDIDVSLQISAVAVLARSQGGELIARQAGEASNAITVTAPLELDLVEMDVSTAA